MIDLNTFEDTLTACFDYAVSKVNDSPNSDHLSWCREFCKRILEFDSSIYIETVWCQRCSSVQILVGEQFTIISCLEFGVFYSFRGEAYPGEVEDFEFVLYSNPNWIQRIFAIAGIKHDQFN